MTKEEKMSVIEAFSESHNWSCHHCQSYVNPKDCDGCPIKENEDLLQKGYILKFDI